MKLKSMMLILIVLFCQAGTVWGAENVFIPSKECVITVDLETDKLSGKILSVYQIGEVKSVEKSLSYQAVGKWKDSGVNLQKLMTSTNSEKEKDAEILYNFAKENSDIKTDFVLEIDKEGKAEMRVPAGMYLICQFEESDEYEIQSVIAAVPNVNETLDEWEYERSLKPKFVLHSDAPDTGDYELLAKKVEILGALGVCLAIFTLTIVYIWRVKSVRREKP